MLKYILIVIFAISTAHAEESVEQIFAKRSTLGLDTVTSLLRQRLQGGADNKQVRYFLATVLLERQAGFSDVVEALALLDGLEKERAPDWLPAWALARRMQAAVQIQQLNHKQGMDLPEQTRALTGGEEFQSFLRQQLASLDASLAPMREGLQLTKALRKNQFSAEEVKADLQQIHDLLRAHWSYEAEKQRQTGRSLMQLLTEARKEIKPMMGRRDANEILVRFVAALEDGHTFLTPLFNEPILRLPFRAIDTQEGVVIAETAESLPLRPGDRVLEVNGITVETVVKKWASLCSVSTAAARRAHAVAKLPLCIGGERSLSLRIERDGEEVMVKVSESLKDSLHWTSNVEKGPWVRSKLIEPGVGYLRIVNWAPISMPPEALGADSSKRAAFFQPLHHQIDQALEPLRDCHSIVIDVRGNGGGYDDLSCYLASYFVGNRQLNPYVLRYRAPNGVKGKPSPDADSDGFLNKKRVPATYTSYEGPAWKSRLFILVDEHCFSATDTFLHVLTEQTPAGQVTTIGRASSGGIGGPKPVGRLEHTGAELTLSNCKAFSLGGALLEGRPARLDVLVTWTRDDILNRRDADFEEALRRAKDNH